MTQDNTFSDNQDPFVAISQVRIEHLRETLGIGADHPRLSWLLETNIPGWRQAAYEIACLDANDVLQGQTGRVASGQSVLIDWPFAPLASRERRTVRVRVWGMDGRESPWSEPVSVEAGLLKPEDWTARFIAPDWEEDTGKPQPSPLLRREFDAHAGVQQARLYITALGVFELYLNGQIVGDHVMDPGWTSYHHRLIYQTFDVSSLLRAGRNALGAMLGDGWFRGRLGFGGGKRNIYGDRLALLAQLEITYADGTVQRIVTDETWRAMTGPILAGDIYDGETYDARLERSGWSQPGYRDAEWKAVRTVERDFATLVAPAGPPVRRTELTAPVAILTTPSGRTLLDFGQNLVGRLRLAVQGPRGHTITLRHAEVLENGELCTRPLRTAQATDSYTLSGEGTETWEARFTFHGFRYAEIANWPGELRAGDICAVVCHSDMERTGWFECSDPLIDRLHENTVWSTHGNFLSIPTDCPQRDERLGWTGDIQIFSPAACFLYDTSGFLSSWLQDLVVEQRDWGGMVPAVIPNTISGWPMGAAAWGDAAVIVPWVLYQRFGDRAILSTHFESMRAWVDWIASVASDGRLWDHGFQLGDWLDPAAPSDRPREARTDHHLVATAYFARSAELVELAARVLGLHEQEIRYGTLAREIREAFANEYAAPAGRLMSDTQTAYALAIEFGLLPRPEQRQRAAARLVELVRADGYHIGTGFVGTPLICDALCDTGNHAAAFRLLMQRECPSWLYPVTMGATTIWERWDSLLPDGSVNPGEMTSFNHYALGAVADWLHRIVGGLAPAEPGYHRIAIQPRPGGGISQASVRHLTPYGIAASAWTIQDGSIDVRIVVPPNTTAQVILPGSEAGPLEIGSGHYHWSYPYRDPDALPRLSIDSTIGEFMDHPRTWAAVLDMLARLNPENGLVKAMLSSQSRATLRQVLDLLPDADDALAAIANVVYAGEERR